MNWWYHTRSSWASTARVGVCLWSVPTSGLSWWCVLVCVRETEREGKETLCSLQQLDLHGLVELGVCGSHSLEGVLLLGAAVVSTRDNETKEWMNKRHDLSLHFSSSLWSSDRCGRPRSSLPVRWEMSRHAKNNTAGPCFTHAERERLEYGTIKQRIGGDSIKPFDCCNLCLKPFQAPMAWFVPSPCLPLISRFLSLTH